MTTDFLEARATEYISPVPDDSHFEVSQAINVAGYSRVGSHTPWLLAHESFPSENTQTQSKKKIENIGVKRQLSRNERMKDLA